MPIMTFLVRFLSVFFNFFLLNAIYLGYKICLRSFASLWSVYVELCGSCVKMPVLHFRVCFLSDFFHFFFLLIIFYLGYEIHLQSFVRLCAVCAELCWSWVKMPYCNLWCVFLSVLFLFFCWLWSIKATVMMWQLYAYCPFKFHRQIF